MIKERGRFYPYQPLKVERVQSVGRIDETLATKPPLLYVPGMAEGFLSCQLLPVLATTRPVFGFANTPAARMRFGEKLTDPEDIKANRLIESLHELKEQGVDHLNLLLHSEAGVFGTMAVAQIVGRPEEYPQIDNLILVDAAGIAPQAPLQLGLNFAASALDWHYPEVQKAIHMDRHFRRKSFMSFPPRPYVIFTEMTAIARANVVPQLQELQQKGVAVHVITSNEDIVFRYKKTQKVCENAGIPVSVLTGPHQAIQMASHAKEYADAIEHLLTK